MPIDYFKKMAKKTQPMRDAFSKPKQDKATPTAPKPAESKPMAKAGELQGESLEDWTYMRKAQEKINQKLAPKSIMGKSSSKR